MTRVRTLILRQPPPHAAESLPACFASPVDEPALREWLAHPGALRCTEPVRSGARFDEAITAAIAVEAAGEEGVLVVYVPSLTVISREDASSLGLDAAFARTAAATEETAEQLIEEAEASFERDDWDGAERLFRRVDELLADEASARRAEVLGGLGEISRLQGRTAEAITLLDRALSLSPLAVTALSGRATIARSLGEHAIASGLVSRLAELTPDPRAQSELFEVVASESLEAARQAISRALELRPGDATLLERLRAAHEAAGCWDDAVSVSVSMAELMTDPRERARAFAEAADACVERARNPARAAS